MVAISYVTSASNHHRCCHGFTLIEMVTTIIIIGTIAAVLSPFLRVAVEGFSDTRSRTELTAAGRLLLERISRDIREAGPDTVTVSGAGNDRLQFTVLKDLNSIVPSGSSMIKTYQNCATINVWQSGSDLLWDADGDGTSDSILSNSLNDISFGYTPGTTHRSGVITVSLTLSDGGESISLYREIHIRNTIGTCI